MLKGKLKLVVVSGSIGCISQRSFLSFRENRFEANTGRLHFKAGLSTQTTAICLGAPHSDVSNGAPCGEAREPASVSHLRAPLSLAIPRTPRPLPRSLLWGLEPQTQPVAFTTSPTPSPNPGLCRPDPRLGCVLTLMASAVSGCL